MNSSDSSGICKITNKDFQLNHFGGLPMERVELLNDQLPAAAFADWNLEDRLAKMSIANGKYQTDTLSSAQAQSIAPCIFNELNQAKTGLQNAENYFNSGQLLNDGIGCVSDLPFRVDTQSPAAYSHPEHVDQSQFVWRNIEEEWLYKMLKQRKPYHQLQQNHQSDAWKLIHANSNMFPGLINQNQGHSLQSYGVPRLLNRSTLGFSYEDPDSIEVLDKVSQQSCPGKILKQSNGLNTLRAMELGPVPGDEPLNSIAQNRKFVVSGQVCYSLSDSNSGLGNLAPQFGPLSNINGLREADTMLLSHLDKVRGCVYRLAKDQNGCRYLQQKFSEGRPKEVEIIFHEVLEHIADLMTDPFGNYFIQKLVQVCDDNQTMLILQVITQRPGDLIRISCDMHG